MNYPIMAYLSSVFLLTSIVLILPASLNTLLSSTAMGINGLGFHLLDTLILAASATLWTLSFSCEILKGNAGRVGMSRSDSFASSSFSPGFGMLWAAVGAKLLAKPQLIVIVIIAALCVVPPVALVFAYRLFIRGGKEGLQDRWEIVRSAFSLQPIVELTVVLLRR